MDAKVFDEAHALATIRDVLGPPPKEYNAFLAAAVSCLQPANVIDCIRVKEFVDRSWDINRYQRMKGKWISANNLVSPSVSPDKAFAYDRSPQEATIAAVDSLQTFERLQESTE